MTNNIRTTFLVILLYSTHMLSQGSIAVMQTGIFNDNNTDGIAQVGETITFNYTVVNTGTEDLFNVQVFGGETSINGNSITLLAGSTDSVSFTGTYTIDQEDINQGASSNIATMVGYTSTGTKIYDISDYENLTENRATTITLATNPCLKAMLSGISNDENGNNEDETGETITYTYTLSNDGNVDIEHVSVEDPLFLAPNPIKEILYNSGDVNGDEILNTGESWTFNVDYTITDQIESKGVISNQATAKGYWMDKTHQVDVISEKWGIEGELSTIYDFSNAGYMQNNVPMPDWPIGVNVLNYGADNTGLNDNKQAFINAIAACPPNHAVFVPNGTYKLTDSLSIKKSNIVFRGEDMYSTVIDIPVGLGELYDVGDPKWGNSQGTSFFNFLNGSQKGIENLSIRFRDIPFQGHHEDRTGFNAVSMGWGGTTGVSNGWIRNIYIINSADHAIEVKGSDHITVQNIVLDNTLNRYNLTIDNGYHVGHTGIRSGNSQFCLFHQIYFSGRYVHDFYTNANFGNVLSKITFAIDGAYDHHALGDDNNLITDLKYGNTSLAIAGSNPGFPKWQNEVYWNMTGKVKNSYLNPYYKSTMIGFDTDMPTDIGSDYWHETVNPYHLEPKNLFLAQLKKNGKTLQDAPLDMPGTLLSSFFLKENTIGPTDDAWTNAVHQTLPFGASQSQIVRTTGNGNHRVGFFKFDLSNINNPEVEKAIFRVSLNNGIGSPKPTTIHVVGNDSWTESSITWGNQPAWDPDPAIPTQNVTGPENSWQEFDITNLVNQELAGDKVLSFTVLSDGPTFNSSESQPLYTPELVFTPKLSETNSTRVDDLTGTTLNSNNTYHLILRGDRDNDAISDAQDLDDDNDGILDVDEQIASIDIDTDEDSIPDRLDLDSDGDGIADIVEAAGEDANNDGEVDYPTPGDASTMVDANNNGWASVFDNGTGDALPTEGGTPLTDPDSDSDTVLDRLDLDSDDDAIPDNVEGQSTGGYTAPGGTSFRDGFDTSYPGGITPVDTEGDGTPDYLDLDSDGDTVNDVDENYNPLIAVTTVGTNGLENATDTLDDYADVNGMTHNGTNFSADFADTDSDVATGGDYDYRDLNETVNLFGTRIISSLQNGTVTPNKIDAYLHIVSNNWGVVITRVAGVANINNPVEGMLVFDTSDDTFKVCTDAATPTWRALGN